MYGPSTESDDYLIQMTAFYFLREVGTAVISNVTITVSGLALCLADLTVLTTDRSLELD
jgi:hypothetical protein